MMLEKVKAWLSLVRIGNVLMMGLATIVGYVSGGGSRVEHMLLATIVAMLVGAGGNIVNDYFDRFIDAVNKPWRPIPSGIVSPSTAHIASIGFMTTGIALSILLPFPCFIIAVIASLLLYEYSHWIKRTGIPGNIVIALLSGLSILYGGFAAGNPEASILPSLYAFLLIFGREIYKGIEDVEGDRKYSIYTVAVVLGERAAFIVGTIILLLVIAISPIPYVMYGYNVFYLVLALLGVDLLIAYSIYLIAKNPGNAWRATRILKIPLLIGLLAFLVGVL